MTVITVRSDQPVRVEGDFEGRTLAAGQVGEFTTTSGEVTTRLASPEEIAPPPVTDDVFDPSNRPNGAMTAGIAPKMPKSSGELVQIVEDGVVKERAAADLGQATQGGGPDSPDTITTPGPQITPQDAPTGSGLAAATGDVNEKGQPVPRTTEAVQSAPAPAKKK